ncbi:MAG: nucleotidyltransferase domain-containing protein [Candidatus Hatepunaea meridiana]|nr:nucleotidyltransferase domain-containing protein [Candidatus Hatepunaea meridiana]
MVSDITIVKERAQLAVLSLSEHVNITASFLFGSHVNGTNDKYSDIDVGAFVEDYNDLDLDEEVKISVQIQKKVGFDIELHFFNASDLTNAEPASFASYVIKNGIPLSIT